MQTSEELVVGEKSYSITTFPAFKGLSYLQKLLKVFGPSLGELFSTASMETVEEFSIEEEALTKSISLLVENLDQANIAQLAKDMVSDGVTINGQTVLFDQEFSANYGALISILGAVIRVNYSSFFDGSGFGGLAKLLPQPLSNNE